MNVFIAEDYLKKWISLASGSRMPDIVKFRKTMTRHIEGILAAIRSEINSALMENLNNKSVLRSRVPMASRPEIQGHEHIFGGRGFKLPHNVR